MPKSIRFSALLAGFVFSLLAGFSAHAKTVVSNENEGPGETIVAHEVEKHFYRNGRMRRYEGQLEYTYHFDPAANKLVRTRVYDFRDHTITPDETVYEIQEQLDSHPNNAQSRGLAPFVRAVGQTGPDALEIIVIKGDIIETLQSTPDSLIIARCKRLK